MSATKEYLKAYREKNKEQLKARRLEWVATHKAQIKERQHAWYSRNTGSSRQKGKAWRMANPLQNALLSRRSLWKREYGLTEADVCAMLATCKNACAGCSSFLDILSCTMDHILAHANGGTTDRANLQLLCLPCNKAKQAMSMREFIELCRRVTLTYGVKRASLP